MLNVIFLLNITDYKTIYGHLARPIWRPGILLFALNILIIAIVMNMIIINVSREKLIVVIPVLFRRIFAEVGKLLAQVRDTM